VVIFKQFMIFAAVAKHRNVTRASEELRISQPGVSQQLKLLEQNFGVKLFKRGGRGVDLTDAGRLFLDKITPIMSQVENLNKTFGPRSLAPKIHSLVVGGT
jgi:DNA-binding transcriptional LysR family regulator